MSFIWLQTNAPRRCEVAVPSPLRSCRREICLDEPTLIKKFLVDPLAAVFLNVLNFSSSPTP